MRDFYLGLGLDVTEWRAMPGRTPWGLVTVCLPQVGLVIRSCVVMAPQPGQPFVVPPARPVLNARGNAVVTPNGKRAQEHVLTFANRAASRGFSDAVLDRLRERHPEALDGA